LKEFDNSNSIDYNILNKGTVGQLIPDRRENKALKIAPYFTRAGALFFVFINHYNKGYNSTKHDDKSK
jgi:hypothetical protein